MQTLLKPVYYGSRSDQIHLWHLTDLHLGARACDEKLLDKHIEEIANDPLARWIGGGDYVEAIGYIGDKRFQMDTLAPWLWGTNDIMGAQARYAVDKLSPIADKCLALVGGNHEHAAQQYHGRELYWEIVCGIAKAGNVPPETLGLGYQGFVVAPFRRGTPESYGSTWYFSIRVHHGYGGGSNHTGTLYEALSTFEADLTLFGHRHVRAFADMYTVAPDAKKGWKQKYRAGVFTASFLNAYIKPSTPEKPIDTYIKRTKMKPMPLGTRPITIDPDAQTFEVVMRSDKVSLAS